jgi:hypothetical protein
VGVHAEHEERLLEATAGLEAVEQDDERVAMMNNQALDAMGLGLGA